VSCTWLALILLEGPLDQISWPGDASNLGSIWPGDYDDFLEGYLHQTRLLNPCHPLLQFLHSMSRQCALSDLSLDYWSCNHDSFPDHQIHPSFPVRE
jgi:hypothetical protein